MADTTTHPATIDTERVCSLVFELLGGRTDIAAQVCSVYPIDEPAMWDAVAANIETRLSEFRRDENNLPGDHTDNTTIGVGPVVSHLSLVFGHPYVNQDALLRIVRAADAARVLTWPATNVADHPNTRSDVLLCVAENLRISDPGIAYMFATHPNANDKLLCVLAERANAETRLCTLEHLPPAALWVLSRHYKAKVRVAVAQHPSAPTKVLETLAEDHDYQVRVEVVKNPNTPLAAIRACTGDGNDSVTACAYRALLARGALTFTG